MFQNIWLANVPGRSGTARDGKVTLAKVRVGRSIRLARSKFLKEDQILRRQIRKGRCACLRATVPRGYRNKAFHTPAQPRKPSILPEAGCAAPATGAMPEETRRKASKPSQKEGTAAQQAQARLKAPVSVSRAAKGDI